MEQYVISNDQPSSLRGNYHKSKSISGYFPNLMYGDSEIDWNFETIKFGSRFNKWDDFSELLIYGVTGNIPPGDLPKGTYYLGKLTFNPEVVDHSELNRVVSFLSSEEGCSELEKIVQKLL